MLYNQEDPHGFGSAHIGINLLDRSANYDVADIAQPRNVSESQHGKMMILKAIPHP